MGSGRAMSREEVRAVDRWAIEHLGLPGLVLMENAARNVADAAGAMLTRPSARVAVLAGAGNNGGDGFAAGRHLTLRGAAVTVYLLAGREKIVGDALVNLNVTQRLAIPIVDATSWDRPQMLQAWQKFDLLMDALGGTGITGALRGPVALAVEAANAAGVPILAVDIPTGLDCDTGEAYGPTIRAARTVTLVARKKGFDAPAAAEYTGEVVVADIGVPVKTGPAAF